MNSPWRTYRLETDGTGVAVYELDSGRDGPCVLVLGGVHGNEVGGIVGAGRLTAKSIPLKAGLVRVVPVTHEAAFAAHSRTSPLDGDNLARVFPGDPAGSATTRLAALVADRLIRHSDVLIDLHTSSPLADMPFMAGGLDDGSEVGTRNVELAIAFGADTVWTHPSLAPGRTLTCANDHSIPAIYVESPRGGVLNQAYLDAYPTGVLRVLNWLGMTATSPDPAPPPTLWLHGEGASENFAATPVDGLFLAEVDLLSGVDQGQRIGQILNARGGSLHEVEAPEAGYVAMLQRDASVKAGTPIVGIVPERPTALGIPSDAIFARTTRSSIQAPEVPLQ